LATTNQQKKDPTPQTLGTGPQTLKNFRLADRQWLVGGRYSIADISLYAYTHVAEEGGFDLEPYPAIRAWIARVAEQPGHVPITA
jgi:glutathione S-transferase